MATQLKYYTLDKILSYNANWNMILGPRGDGKTYSNKVRAIKKNIKNGEEFILLRRYSKEVPLAATTFFADVDELFPDWDFKVGGSAAYRAHVSTRGEKKRDWVLMGYFIALSRAQQYKGASFHNVTTIIFDEFVIEKGMVRYLPNEATVLLNFFSTVDRNKDKTRLFMLANAVSIENPYFIEYDIDPDKKDKNGFIRIGTFLIVQFIDDDEYVHGVSQTEFGRFIQGSEYAKYAVQNEFADNNKNLIEQKPAEAHYNFTIEAHNGSFSVWFSRKTGKYYAQEKLTGNDIVFTLVKENMSEGKTLATFQDKFMGTLRTAYRHGRMKFDRASTRNAFLEIFKR